MDAKLVQTQIEDRDGRTWVTGLCSYCWERVGVHAPEDGAHVTTWCPNGHRVAVEEQRSAGAEARGQAWSPANLRA
jgi:hypothetical protein